MRINKFIAQATGISRRAADAEVAKGAVSINGQRAATGQEVTETDTVLHNNRPVTSKPLVTIMLNKPAGYICSRDGQGGQTVYDLLPPKYFHLKPVGRLDKHTSGLLLLTNDGQLAQKLTHPSYQKDKIYEVKLDKELTKADFETITKTGVKLEDGVSKLGLDFINDKNFEWKVTMHEGRNRQIRRTFEALDYHIVRLHRTHFGEHELSSLQPGAVKII
jgi:23S rRNA pseudouridine2605 synthase